jgi:hypothetical protein
VYLIVDSARGLRRLELGLAIARHTARFDHHTTTTTFFAQFHNEENPMRKRILATAFLLAGTAMTHAADLTIPAGQTYTITPEQSDLRLEKLTIGSGARVRFAPGVSRWRVVAKHVSVGDNVVIDGRGGDGAAGVDAAAFAERAKDCDPGAQGRAGGAGGAGARGTALELWWGIDTLGSAKLLTDGGAGGIGGAGGAGQDGGKVNRCAGPAAGNGGTGGTGGAGGNAGEVSLSYYDAGGKSLAIGDRLSVSAAGGTGGAAGSGGAGGAGADGRFQRTATSEAWFPAGKPGSRGGAGQPGTAGSNGEVAIKAVATGSRPSWANEIGSTASADRGTVQALQQQVQALQAGGAADASLADQLRAMQDQIKRLEQRVKALEAR